MAPSSPRDHRAVSPWAQVAAAGAASPSSPPPPPSAAAVATVSTDPDSSEGLENNGSEKKTAWSKPANGVSEVGPVMGAASWPALGESSKVAVQKSFSSDPITAPPAPAPAVVPNHHHQMKVNPNSSNTNPNPRPQRHMRRGGSFNNNHHGSMANGGHIPSAPVERPPQILPEKPALQGLEPSPRNNNSNWDHGYSSRGTGLSPHSHGPDHHRPFNRRGNNGGSSGPHNGGGRRDPDRGGYANDWNNPPPRHLAPAPLRGHHARFPIMRSSPPPPPPGAAAPFVAPPPPIRSFVSPPMAFPAEIPPPPPFFYVPASPPFVAAHHPVAHAIPPAMLLNPTDTLRTDVLRQIEYYFR